MCIYRLSYTYIDSQVCVCIWKRLVTLLAHVIAEILLVCFCNGFSSLVSCMRRYTPRLHKPICIISTLVCPSACAWKIHSTLGCKILLDCKVQIFVVVNHCAFAFKVYSRWHLNYWYKGLQKPSIADCLKLEEEAKNLYTTLFFVF